MVFVKEAQSHNDRTVASAQEEIRRLARDGNALQPEAASSINSGLSIIGKIIGQGALTIFGRVEGEVHASTVVIAEGAEMLGDVVAEDLTVAATLRAPSVPIASDSMAPVSLRAIFSIEHWRSRRMLGSRERRAETKM
jgi:hypothetical protein